MAGEIDVRSREAKFLHQRTSVIAFYILPIALKRTSMIFSLSIIPGDSKFFLVEAKLSHLEAKPSHVEAKLSYVDAKPSHVDAKLSHVEAKLSYVEAKPSHVDAKLSYVEAKLSHVDAKLSHVLRSPIDLPASRMTKPGLNTFKKSLANA